VILFSVRQGDNAVIRLTLTTKGRTVPATGSIVKFYGKRPGHLAGPPDFVLDGVVQADGMSACVEIPPSVSRLGGKFACAGRGVGEYGTRTQDCLIDFRPTAAE
jgi:hypothetical protein